MTDTPDAPGHISRRRFIIGGAAVVGGAAFLNACGDDDDDDADGTEEGTTGGEAAATTAPAGGAATTAAAATGGTIKIGYVTPQTGALAPFGEADAFVPTPARRSRRASAIGGATYAIEILDRDSESNSNTAATVAQELIVQDGVQLMRRPDARHDGSRRADCTNNEIPVLSNNAVAAALSRHRRAARSGHHAPRRIGVDYHFFWGLEDVIQVAMWKDVAPGGVVGAMWPDDPDGNAERPQRRLPTEARRSRLHARRPGPLPARHDRLHRPDLAVQGRRRRDRDGRDDPARLRCLLDAVPAAGFQPKAVTLGKSCCSPAPSPRTEPDRAVVGDLVVRPPPDDVEPDGADVGRSSPLPTRRPPAASGHSRWVTHRCSRSRIDALKRAGGVSDKQALLDAMGATAPRRSPARSTSPIRWSRTSPRPRSWAANGWRARSGTSSSRSSPTSNCPASRSTARWSRSRTDRRIAGARADNVRNRHR